MADDDIEVRAYEPGDADGVRGVLRAAMGASGTFDRLSEDNPAGKPIRVVAYYGPRLVGFNMWNAWLIRTPMGIVPVHQSGGSAVDPTCRGKHVFARLLGEGERQARARDVGFFLGFPNPQSVGSLLRAGWKHVADMHLRASAAVSRGVPDAGDVRSMTEGALESRFAAWRYGRTSVHQRSVTRDGRRVTVYFRHDTPAVIKVMDVIDEQGERAVHTASWLTRALPGPALVLTRATSQRSLRAPLTVPVYRRWKTPVTVKNICGSAEHERALAEAYYCYGDIDAL